MSKQSQRGKKHRLGLLEDTLVKTVAKIYPPSAKGGREERKIYAFLLRLGVKALNPYKTFSARFLASELAKAVAEK